MHNESLMKEMILLQEKQTVFLESIEFEIKNLQEGPLYAGFIYLEEASNQDVYSDLYYENLNDARKQFVNFIGYQNAKNDKTEQEYYRIGFAQFYTGLCFLLLNNRLNALKWFNKSIDSLNESLIAINRSIDMNTQLLEEKRNKRRDLEEKMYLIDSREKLVSVPLFITMPALGLASSLTYKKAKKKLLTDPLESKMHEIIIQEQEIYSQEIFRGKIEIMKVNINYLLKVS